MNSNNLLLIGQLREYAFNKDQNENSEESVHLIQALDYIWQFDAFAKQRKLNQDIVTQGMTTLLQPFLNDRNTATIAKQIISNLTADALKVSPMQDRVSVILNHPWQSDAIKEHIKKVLVPNLDQKSSLGLREFNQRLKDALKPLTKEKKAPAAVRQLLKIIDQQNKDYKAKAKEAAKQVKEIQARLKAPLKLDASNGYATFRAFQSMLEDTHAMVKALETYKNYVSGKEYQSVERHLERWFYLSDSLNSFIKDHGDKLKTDPDNAFPKLQDHLSNKVRFIATDKDIQFNKTDFDIFSKFLHDRVDAIASAENFTVSLKIDFNELNKNLEKTRKEIDSELKRLGIPLDGKEREAINQVLAAYAEQVKILQPGYNELMKQEHHERDYGAINRIYARLNLSQKLITDMTSSLEDNFYAKNASNAMVVVLDDFAKQNEADAKKPKASMFEPARVFYQAVGVLSKALTKQSFEDKFTEKEVNENFKKINFTNPKSVALNEFKKNYIWLVNNFNQSVRFHQGGNHHISSDVIAVQKVLARLAAVMGQQAEFAPIEQTPERFLMVMKGALIDANKMDGMTSYAKNVVNEMVQRIDRVPADFQPTPPPKPPKPAQSLPNNVVTLLGLFDRMKFDDAKSKKLESAKKSYLALATMLDIYLTRKDRPGQSRESMEVINRDTPSLIKAMNAILTTMRTYQSAPRVSAEDFVNTLNEKLIFASSDLQFSSDIQKQIKALTVKRDAEGIVKPTRAVPSVKVEAKTKASTTPNRVVRSAKDKEKDFFELRNTAFEFLKKELDENKSLRNLFKLIDENPNLIKETKLSSAEESLLLKGKRLYQEVETVFTFIGTLHEKEMSDPRETSMMTEMIKVILNQQVEATLTKGDSRIDQLSDKIHAMPTQTLTAFIKDAIAEKDVNLLLDKQLATFHAIHEKLQATKLQQEESAQPEFIPQVDLESRPEYDAEVIKAGKDPHTAPLLTGEQRLEEIFNEIDKLAAEYEQEQKQIISRAVKVPPPLPTGGDRPLPPIPTVPRDSDEEKEPVVMKKSRTNADPRFFAHTKTKDDKENLTPQQIEQRKQLRDVLGKELGKRRGSIEGKSEPKPTSTKPKLGG